MKARRSITGRPARNDVSRVARRGSAAVAVATVALAASAAAQAAIVPNVSIAEARIGMTEKQIRSVLGTPQSTYGNVKSKELGYGKVTAVLVNGKVLGLTTKAGSQKVSGTVGVGVSESKLRATVKGLTCVVNFGTRVCNLLPPNRMAGQAFTEFVIDAGKISRISIRTGDPLTQS